MMRLKLTILAISILTLAMLMPQVFAQQSVRQCVDNETLSVQFNETRCIDGICKEFSRDTLQYCNFGCDSVTQTCSPDSFTVNMYLVGGFILFIIIMAILFKRLGGK
ncbi:hypothetical protein KKC87_04440 [Patescibacteria group bacterium]|nr:hypothetical protein [Patescibacteria group bacterium]